MNPFGGASVAVKPPEKGSFPLDRAGQVRARCGHALSMQQCLAWPDGLSSIIVVFFSRPPI